MAWTTPRTWVSGEVPTAANFNTHVRDNFKAIGDAWGSYTPTWASSGTAPTIGNGTLAGYYLQAGKLVIGRIVLTIGGTTGVGTGSYSMSLPVNAAVTGLAAVGSCGFYDNSGGYYDGTALRNATNAGQCILILNNARWSATAPVAPASGDIISVQFTYEAA